MTRKHPLWRYLSKVVLLCILIASTGGVGGWAAPSLQIYFSPQDQIAEHLISLIDKEEKRILAAVYCLTHRGIADALTRAKRRGVKVEVIVDPFSLKNQFALSKLNTGKVEVSIWDPELTMPLSNGKKARDHNRRPLMHDKFCVFGDSIVWTGSFNFTYDATEFHRENVVVIEDREIALQYQKQFDSIKEEGCRSYRDFMALLPTKQKTIIDAIKRR